MKYYSENQIAGCITAGFLVGMAIGIFCGVWIAVYLT